MEEVILESVLERNKILEEIIRINHLAISEFASFDEQDLIHFYMTRTYFIKALVEAEDNIIARSMLGWSQFRFSDSYKGDYISLCREKNEMVTLLVQQDKILEFLLNPNKEFEACEEKRA